MDKLTTHQLDQLKRLAKWDDDKRANLQELCTLFNIPVNFSALAGAPSDVRSKAFDKVKNRLRAVAGPIVGQQLMEEGRLQVGKQYGNVVVLNVSAQYVYCLEFNETTGLRHELYDVNPPGRCSIFSMLHVLV